MTAQERMIRMYDRAMVSGDYRQFYEDSGFYNFGYWDAHATSQREASEALVDQLVDRIATKGGRILDVACGPGATTKRLMRSYARHDHRHQHFRGRSPKPASVPRLHVSPHGRDAAGFPAAH
jgi:cyclopropane fatty-acyl-phospholipid synthase-like methyltransferase